MSKDYHHPTEEMSLVLRLHQRNLIDNKEMSLLIDLIVKYIQLRKNYSGKGKDES